MAFIMFFAIGVVEMFIVAAWTKCVSGSQVVASGIVTFVNTIVYLYVLDALLSNVSDVPVIMAYAAGCAAGTMLAASPKFEEGLELTYASIRKLMQRDKQFSPHVNEANPIV